MAGGYFILCTSFNVKINVSIADCVAPENHSLLQSSNDFLNEFLVVASTIDLRRKVNFFTSNLITQIFYLEKYLRLK